MCCKQLAENAGHKNDAKNRQLSTVTQICQAISSQLRHVSTIGKEIAKQQYLLQMSLQYGELRPTNGWDRLADLGHPSYFSRYRVLAALLHGSQVGSGRQPNFAALNRGRHLCSAGRPSRWALAHILVFIIMQNLAGIDGAISIVILCKFNILCVWLENVYSCPFWGFFWGFGPLNGNGINRQ